MPRFALVRPVLPALVALFCAVLTPAAGAQSYPVKPVRVIVPQAPGGASDLLVRLIGQRLGAALGQQFIVDNRPGAGGTIGAAIAAKAAPDGYTLLSISAPHTAAPSLYRRLPYDLARDFAPVGLLGSEPLCVVVHPALPASLADLVAYLKAHPGQVSYGSTGNGAVNHLATELFRQKAGVDVVHVPYKGSAFAIPDLIDGRIGLLFANVSPLLPHVRSGRVKAVAVTSRSRVAPLAEVPTVAESGYPGYEAVNWFGLVAPAGTPVGIVRALNAHVEDTLRQTDVRDTFEKRGAQTIAGSPDAMREFIAAEMRKWSEVVRISGARID
jgi:tripartite-type tricarboxylate transporter receptor subunit TctC